MGKSAWADHERIEPTKLPDLTPAFGAQVGWGVDRAVPPRRRELFCLLATQEVVVEYLCPVCGDGSNLAGLVCMCCHRSEVDADVEQLLRDRPAPRPDTDKERQAWEALPDEQKFPSRRPTPPPSKSKVATPAEPKPRAGTDAYLYQTPGT